MSSRRWCFTVNNYDEAELSNILKWDVKYLVVGRETGEENQTPHLQGFVIFKKVYRLSGCKKLQARAHWEVANGTSFQASAYCKKEGAFEEIGVLSEQGRRTDLENACNLVRQTGSVSVVADEYPSTFVKFSRGLRDLALEIVEPYDHVSVRGIWIYGPPGTGKTHCARHFDPHAYMKAQNKWWDGYAGQDTVILDDLDTDVLGHHLKIWSDKWSCTGETKGGTVQLRHKLFVVTSNYGIDELFSDKSMCEAIQRRFKVIEKLDRNQLIDFLILN